MKFEKNFMMCNLDNFNAILNITFIDSNRMDVLRGGCKLKSLLVG
jgi:hypothetical protein